MTKKTTSATTVANTIDLSTAAYNQLVSFASSNGIKMIGLKKEELRAACLKFQSKTDPEVKKSLDEKRVPRAGSTSEKIVKMLNEGNNRYFVAKILQQHYSFIHSVAKRYSHLITTPKEVVE